MCTKLGTKLRTPLNHDNLDGLYYICKCSNSFRVSSKKLYKNVKYFRKIDVTFRFLHHNESFILCT